jgi:hypothetical protein
MIDTLEFSNFVGGFQFALLSQSLLYVAVSKPSLLVVIMHISFILGLMNIFSQNITYETKKPIIEVESDDDHVEDNVDEIHEAVVADEVMENEEAIESDLPKSQDNIDLD